MPGTPLSVSKNDLCRYIGRHVGWALEFDSWSDREQADGTDILNRGLRQFYNPDILPGEAVSWRWSFLRPFGQIVTVNNQEDYDLPDDFGGIMGGITYNDDNLGQLPITKVPEQRIRELRQGGTEETGYPAEYCISPRASGQGGQAWVLRVHPAASGAYTLEFRYQSNPFQLTDNAPYPLGGQPHAETLVASVIAAADAVLGDDPNGQSYQNFITKLRVSISHDRQETESRNLGYFGDGPIAATLPSRSYAITFDSVDHGSN